MTVEEQSGETVGSYEWARKELQRTQQELHDVRERFRVATKKREKAELELHAERGGSEAWRVWAAGKTGLLEDAGVADVREAIDRELVRLEEENDELKREVVDVKCRTSDTIEEVRRYFEEKTEKMRRDLDRRIQQLLKKKIGGTWGRGIKHRIGMRALVRTRYGVELAEIVRVSPEGGFVRVVFPLAGKTAAVTVIGDDVAPMSIYIGAGC